MKKIKKTTIKKKLSEKELIKESLFLLSEALCSLYETKSKTAQSLCFMVDSCLKYGTVIFRNSNILDAATNYEEYEDKFHAEYIKKYAKKKVKK
jgi:hypothetical protein